MDWASSWGTGSSAGPSGSPHPQWLTSGGVLPSNNHQSHPPPFFPDFDAQMAFENSDAPAGGHGSANELPAPGLFSSMFANPLPTGPMPGGQRGDAAALGGLFGSPGVGGHGGAGRMSAQIGSGAVELGLSGESRLDAGWIAFMRECGIFGMDTS